MGGGFLHVPQWHPGIEGSGDERIPQRVRTYPLADPEGRLAHDPRAAVGAVADIGYLPSRAETRKAWASPGPQQGRDTLR